MAKAKRARYVRHTGTETFVQVLGQDERRTALIVSAFFGNGSIRFGGAGSVIEDGIVYQAPMQPLVLTRELLGDEITGGVFVFWSVGYNVSLVEVTES